MPMVFLDCTIKVADSYIVLLVLYVSISLPLNVLYPEQFPPLFHQILLPTSKEGKGGLMGTQ